MPTAAWRRMEWRSPSARREWIEMPYAPARVGTWASPSARREWIEMPSRHDHRTRSVESPSARREWIEIIASAASSQPRAVSLREEGVD